MKLKNLLILAFLTLTLIPIAIASILLYKSGLDLSEEAYTRNLEESVNVQVDYITQTIENNMLADYRFASRTLKASSETEGEKNNIYSAVQTYLETSEDKVAICLLLDKSSAPIYTIGEKRTVDSMMAGLPDLSGLTEQRVMEFELEKGVYSLGVITPVVGGDGAYFGSMISVYDKSYLFKIISSYYKISDTAIYICRENGTPIYFRGLTDEKNSAFEQALKELEPNAEGKIDVLVEMKPISGYYKNIHNTPWYLAGFVDEGQIYAFANDFIFVYILIIIVVVLADILLAVAFSQRVVRPINSLIGVMDSYEGRVTHIEEREQKNGYYETRYLQNKFFDLMKKISLTQHNFDGIYQLYQSSEMDDINIDIDVKAQVVYSSKDKFRALMNGLVLPPEACVVERFTRCFCDKDQKMLMDMFVGMRDEHLSVPRESEIYTANLDERWFHAVVVPMYSEERLSRLFIQLRDISSFKKQEKESIEQARRDTLTGLYNRVGFSDCVEALLKDADRLALHGLLFLDMDYFKLVNDNFGHSAGDELLRNIGGVLAEVAGTENVAARIGGDEFAVFLPNASIASIDEVKGQLSRRLVFPFQGDGVSFTVTASIGVSLCGEGSSATVDELLRYADTEMYAAKRMFKGKSEQEE